MRLLILLAALTPLAACVGPNMVIVKDPKTGEIRECKSSTNGLSLMAETMAVRDCANGYVAAGWQRMN